MAAVKPLIVPPRPALAVGRVRHVGDPVAFVVADSAGALLLEGRMAAGTHLRLSAGADLSVLGEARANGHLTLLVWVAPEQHYYPRDAAAVDRMFTSLRLVR